MSIKLREDEKERKGTREREREQNEVCFWSVGLFGVSIFIFLKSC